MAHDKVDILVPARVGALHMLRIFVGRRQDGFIREAVALPAM